MARHSSADTLHDSAVRDEIVPKQNRAEWVPVGGPSMPSSQMMRGEPPLSSTFFSLPLRKADEAAVRRRERRKGRLRRREQRDRRHRGVAARAGFAVVTAAAARRRPSGESASDA